MSHRLIRQQIEARITARTIELFCKGERVAVHMRGAGRGRNTTIPEHMPSAHRRYAEWRIERIRIDAAAIGPSTATSTFALSRGGCASAGSWCGNGSPDRDRFG